MKDDPVKIVGQIRAVLARAEYLNHIIAMAAEAAKTGVPSPEVEQWKAEGEARQTQRYAGAN